MFARSAAGAVELIVGVIHLIAAHHGFEAAFIERAVVRYERQTHNKRLNLLPDIREHRRIFSVFFGDAMDERVPIQVIIGLRLN